MATGPTTIRIEDALRPVRSHDNSSSAGGVYNLRNISGTSLDRRTHYPKARRSQASGSNAESGTNDEEGAGLRQASDYKQKQVFSTTQLLWLAYQSIGVIYGDIGTSPLYVFSSTFSSEPSHDDLVGALSLIIWALTMMVTVKYILIILYADNEGEGGTFSCYSLLSRYAHITNRDPREASLVKLERYHTGDLKPANRTVRSRLERSGIAKALLKTIGVLAVSMVMCDGVLTPAQSILGAVQGLIVVKPDITRSTVVGTTCGILIVLFLIQPLGTTKIAGFFAPVVIIWLAFNAAFGIYNLVNFDHSVLKAFSPTFAFAYLIRNGHSGWRSLGGILLAFTGVEALFADLGAFSRGAIQLSWLGYTYPCLLLAYVGQAAFISENEGAFSNPFFNAVPPGTLYPSLVVAVLAAVVASQAIITATFQLLAQIMRLSYFPQIKVVHTSKIFHGQIYVPLISWLLMIGTVLVTAIYNNTTSLGNAYGVCVMFVTFFDTCMVTLAALLVWRFNPFLVMIPWLLIACLDGLFISAALLKVPDGAWFTLTLAAILAAVFILWRYGKEQQWAAEAADRFPTAQFVQINSDGHLQLAEKFGGDSISPIKGLGIYFDKSGETTPLIFSQFLTKLLAAPEVIVFFHIRPLATPSVIENRYHISRLAIPNCYRLIVRHGYMDEVITPDLAFLVYEQIRNFVATTHGAARREGDERTASTSGVMDGKDITDQDTSADTISEKIDDSKSQPIDEPLAAELARLEQAFNRQALYIIGKGQMKVRKDSSIWRKCLLHTFLFLRDNTRSKIANLNVPTDKVIEVGFVKDL